eukprot:Skav213211  [mRNA]  locus=scaffold2826:598583:600823:- [translate_table: standard]
MDRMDLPTALLFVALAIWILARAWHARQRAQRILACADVARRIQQALERHYRLTTPEPSLFGLARVHWVHPALPVALVLQLVLSMSQSIEACGWMVRPLAHLQRGEMQLSGPKVPPPGSPVGFLIKDSSPSKRLSKAGKACLDVPVQTAWSSVLQT